MFQTIQNYIGEEKLQDFINYCLRYLSEIRIPVKRGTFIEFRTGMINVSPIGRSCSREERNQFEAYDKEHQIRNKFIKSIRETFPELKLQYSIGLFFFKSIKKPFTFCHYIRKGLL